MGYANNNSLVTPYVERGRYVGPFLTMARDRSMIKNSFRSSKISTSSLLNLYRNHKNDDETRSKLVIKEHAFGACENLKQVVFDSSSVVVQIHKAAFCSPKLELFAISPLR